jgi:hydrogenase nickel incorporation protein HypA/HybF
MHELTATQGILTIALDEASRIGASRVTRIAVKAGEWSTIEPSCVEFYFATIAKGTPAEDAEISVEVVPVAFECPSCGRQYAPKEGRFSCPGCASGGGKLISGMEFYVDSIEVQHADTCAAESSGRK